MACSQKLVRRMESFNSDPFISHPLEGSLGYFRVPRSPISPIHNQKGRESLGLLA